MEDIPSKYSINLFTDSMTEPSGSSSAVDKLPSYIWLKIFSEYIAEMAPAACPDYCKCKLEPTAGACLLFRKKLLGLRLLCKGFAVVIKQLAFRSVRMRSDWLMETERTRGLHTLLNSDGQLGDVPITHCIRSILWQHNEDFEEADIVPMQAYRNIPNLHSLRIIRAPGPCK
ncbi:hypothetical protein CVT24_006947 [Panaeolus cyanescens]|uniref:Uncharacterized protein n=1 Tax=Panaeolus cyanescens TaxID=181874 RepID=A0A409W5H4_9AGAR|nr:hypothetical protein CVT24_006947 [Panaeolus cyanescens]